MDVEEAFRTHHESLFRYLVRYCGDAQMAMDAVQEAFLRLQRQPSVQPERVRSWLFTTGLNVIRDAHRSDASRRAALESQPDRIPGPRPAPDPERHVELLEDRRRLRAALDGLREKERAALLMRGEGFKHREIAEALDTTTGSVGTLLARALTKLYDAMEDEA